MQSPLSMGVECAGCKCTVGGGYTYLTKCNAALCSTVNGVLTGTFTPHGGHTHCSPTGKLLQICGLSLSCKETQPNTANQARKGKGRGKRQRASRSKVKQNEAKYKQRVYQSNVKKRLLACFLFLASNGTKQRKEQRSTAKEASGASSYGGPA